MTGREAIELLIARPKTTDERREKLEAKLVGPEFPEGLEYLLEWFNDVGPALPGAMGYVPLTYSELQAWSGIHNNALAGWEAELLRQLSGVWCVARVDGRKEK